MFNKSKNNAKSKSNKAAATKFKTNLRAGGASLLDEQSETPPIISLSINPTGLHQPPP